MSNGSIDWLLKRPVNHLGYVVDDIPTAVDEWGKLGIGPFFVVEHVVFDKVERNGEPCVFDHSAAFAWLGDMGVEFHQIHDAQPPDLARELGSGQGNRLNHVAWTSKDPAKEGARLVDAGFPQSCDLLAGPIADQLHYAPPLGHAIEIHLDSEALAGFWTMVAAAADGWDGSDPIRQLTVSEI